MDITILRNKYRIAPQHAKSKVTSSLSIMFRIQERVITEILYRENPILIYSNSVEYATIESFEELIRIVLLFNIKDQFKLA